jgi:hypothetical protein
MREQIEGEMSAPSPIKVVSPIKPIVETIKPKANPNALNILDLLDSERGPRKNPLPAPKTPEKPKEPIKEKKSISILDIDEEEKNDETEQVEGEQDVIPGENNETETTAVEGETNETNETNELNEPTSSTLYNADEQVEGSAEGEIDADGNLVEYEDVEIEVEGGPKFVRRETEFNFESYLIRFINPNILQSYMLLLEYYKENTIESNSCIIRFFQRIANDRHLIAFFFQLHYFIIFDKILQDVTIKTDKQFNEMRGFLKSIVRKFFDLAAENR